MQNKDLLLYFESFLSIINKRNPTNIVGYDRKVESMSNINISYNFSSFITNNTILDQQEDKYKINFHVAITNIRSYLKNEVGETNLIEKLLTFAKDLFS